MKKFLFLLFIIISSITASSRYLDPSVYKNLAPTASIQYLSTDYNKNIFGEPYLVFHFKVEAKRMKGQRINVVIYIEHPKGVGVLDRNNKYKTTDGKVSSSDASAVISFDNALWSDFTVSIPHSEIHPLSGRRSYEVRAIVYTENNTYLASTYCTPFKMTGPEYYEYTRYAGYNTKEVVKEYDNGNKVVTTYLPCNMCQASLTCRMCNGTKRMIVSYYPNTVYGICQFCNGTGRCFCANNEYPGWVPYGKYDEDSKGLKSNFFSYVLPNGSSSSSYSSSGNAACSYCNGTGMDDFPHEYSLTGVYEAGYRSQGLMGYQHNGSGKCRYCDKCERHYHVKCVHCQVQ